MIASTQFLKVKQRNGRVGPIALGLIHAKCIQQVELIFSKSHAVRLIGQHILPLQQILGRVAFGVNYGLRRWRQDARLIGDDGCESLAKAEWRQ